MIEFTHTDDAEEKTFDINPIKGKTKSHLYSCREAILILNGLGLSKEG